MITGNAIEESLPIFNIKDVLIAYDDWVNHQPPPMEEHEAKGRRVKRQETLSRVHFSGCRG